MSSDPKQFALRVLQGFKDAGHHTDEEIGGAGGPSTTTLTKLRKVAEEGSHLAALRGDTLRKIDKAADWTPGSARALWMNGAEPRPVRASGLREALGQSPLTPAQVREARQRQRAVGTLEGYVEHLADRLLEVEERIDYLEQDLYRKLGIGFGSGFTDARSDRPRSEDLSDPDESLPAAAKRGTIEEAGESSI